MIVQNFNIDFNSLVIKKDTATYSFSIVMQTESKEIEKYCFEKWNRLMYVTYILTPEDKLEQIKMESFIKKKLSTSAIDNKNIHKFFYDRSWFTPITQSDNITTIALDDFDCKIWTNPEIPYLQLKGTISIDMNKLLEIYVRKAFITFRHDNKFVSEVIHMQFTRSIPMIMRYFDNPILHQYFVNYVTQKLKTPNNFLLKKLETVCKIKKLHTLKKQVTWENNEIKININDLVAILGIKAKRNILPLTLGGFILYDQVQKNKKQQILDQLSEFKKNKRGL